MQRPSTRTTPYLVLPLLPCRPSKIPTGGGGENRTDGRQERESEGSTVGHFAAGSCTRTAFLSRVKDCGVDMISGSMKWLEEYF